MRFLFYFASIYVIALFSINDYTLAQSDTVYLIFDEPYNGSLPRNFRKCNGGLMREHSTMPDTSGLNNLNISGSAEFNDLNLRTLITTIGYANLIIIDLRQETHGFVNGMCVSWYGKYDWADVGLTREEVITLEKHRLDSLKKTGVATVKRVIKRDKTDDTFTEIKDSTFNITSVMTEEDLVTGWFGGYFRITVADHRQPINTDVDRFVSYINLLIEDYNRFKSVYWLHFHCHAGDGRTTTFMTMFDMMKNAKNVSFDNIITRQYLIGGINLSEDDDFPAWDKQYAIQRTGFLKDFYEYSRTNNDGFKTPYSSWINK